MAALETQLTDDMAALNTQITGDMAALETRVNATMTNTVAEVNTLIANSIGNALMYKGKVPSDGGCDLNFLTPGIYYFTAAQAGSVFNNPFPNDACIVEELGAQGSRRLQRITSYSNPSKMAWRAYLEGGTSRWLDWAIVDTSYSENATAMASIDETAIMGTFTANAFTAQNGTRLYVLIPLSKAIRATSGWVREIKLQLRRGDGGYIKSFNYDATNDCLSQQFSVNGNGVVIQLDLTDSTTWGPNNIAATGQVTVWLNIGDI